MKFCQVHKNVRLTFKPVRIKGKVRAVDTCTECDKLLDELKTKVTRSDT